MADETPDKRPAVEPPAWQFKPGNKLAKGRPKGSRHKISEAFLKAMHEDFREHGKEAIIACRREDPATYVRVIASLLPKDINVTVNPIEAMDDDQLLANISALEDAIRSIIAPVIDGTCSVEGGTQEALGDAAINTLPALH